MSTRRFCDFCDAEISGANPSDGSHSGEAYLADKNHIRRSFKVTISLGITDAITDICTACVLRAARQIDPMPREEQAP